MAYKRDNPYRERGNKAELSLEVLLSSKGLKYTRRGYPDYMVFDYYGDIYGFIEVKPKNTDKLRFGQEKFRKFCKKYNIPFGKWSPGEPYPF